MNAVDMAKMAYGAAAPVRTTRGTEYAVISRVTQRLRNACTEAHQGLPALAQALMDNRRLWRTLAADVASEGNALPRPLRAQIYYLSEFVAQHSRKVLKGEAQPDILININMSIMRGLGTEGGQR